MGQIPAEDLMIPDEWDRKRFSRLGIWMLHWNTRPLVENDITVLDVASGMGEPGPGIIEAIVEEGKTGRYIGIDLGGT